VGDIVEGKIVRLTNFGAFVELHEGIEGLVHVSELDEKRIDKPEDAFKVGDTHPMKIIKLSEIEKKIGLSIRAAKSDEFRSDYEQYRETGPEKTNTVMGDAFRAAQAAKNEDEE
jgi:ribosomal protein S1